MTGFIDLSHDFADGMSGFMTTLPDGSRLRCTAGIRPLITHAESRGSFDGKAEFELTEASVQARSAPTSIRLTCATATAAMSVRSASTSWCCRAS